ncbi:MAG TPA: ATP-binding protein [Steroidobacteraceae bacterium]|nr:ATP-binding protein [Steroidobacteraceae bacterium]
MIAVVLAQAATLYLFARHLERFTLDTSVWVWSRRISEITLLLEQLPPGERGPTIARLKERASRLALHRERRVLRLRAHAWSRTPDLLPPAGAPQPPPRPGIEAGGPPPKAPPPSLLRPHSWPHLFIQLPFTPRGPALKAALTRQLRAELGSGYGIAVRAAAAPAARVIPIPSPFLGLPAAQPARVYDVIIHLPDDSRLIYRVRRIDPGAPLPPSLMLNVILLVILLVAALYIAARGITRPLSQLASAADNIGRGVRQPKLEEKGARELRHAARAFNSMQDRLHRYLDSRTRVLAAMSHDLKTPLTRLRLQVETQIEDPALQARFGKELDEMESMVRGALALFRGLNDEEGLEPVDFNRLLETIRGEFTEMGKDVRVEGRALRPFPGKPQALKRCITNLVGNAINFGVRARILVRDGSRLEISVLDDGPGIPPEELEKVFEPFYRLESSRNRDTGGTGLGLSIARDVAQAHGGALVLGNRPEGGLEARLTLPRQD